MRFAETHLTVPGEFDIYGAQLLGIPGVGIGFTEGVAWTHTVSTGKRITGYNLTLDPASPTSYLVDGESVPMTARSVTIDILRPDGTIDTETRRMWSSEYGPIIDFPGIGWSTTNVLTYRDANIDNNEAIEQYARLSDVQTIDDLVDLNAEYQGVPLYNTVAADSEGNVWYADTSATPNLSAEAEQLLVERLANDPLTQLAYEAGFVLLDGSDSRFRWEVVPGARDPGLVPFDEMPMTERADHVFNANDSFWVPNADTTLTGDYSILHGGQDTPLSMRTRQNTAVLGEANSAGLAGPDGLFDAEEVRTAAFDNTARTAVLLRQSAVEYCRVFPTVDVPEILAADGTVSLPATTVDLRAACSVLADWDGIYDLDRAGPIIWREMMSQFDAACVHRPGTAVRRRVRSSEPDDDTLGAGCRRRTVVALDGPGGAGSRRGGLRRRHDPRCGTVHRTIGDAHPDPRWAELRGDHERGPVERFVVVERAGAPARRGGRRRQFAAR